jgi:ribosomal protein S12 methylthiotransferase
MQCQQDVSRRRLAARVGGTLDVLVDAQGDDGAIARSYADAPEIDGLVRIRGDGASNVAVGELCRVRIVDSDEYDLSAVLA